jgi:hypothetical protein
VSHSFGKPATTPVLPTFPIDDDEAEVKETPPKKSRHDAASGSASTKRENVLDFLRSRPQLASPKESSEPKPTKIKEGSHHLSGKEVDDFIPVKCMQGHESAWQQNEPILSFLRRLPIAEPSTVSVGPWLWVPSPQQKRSWLAQEAKFDKDAFEETALALLASFLKQRTILEAQNQGKAPATITRKMNPYRDVLEENILSTAVKHGVTSGKWMLFPLLPDLPRTWRTVAEATAAGKLGPTSKVGTWEPGNGKKGTLICVYTYDFEDFEDVKRVLRELVELNLVGGLLKAIYYKCDAYTYLDIGSDNQYKLRASLYSSKEVLENEVKVRGDGVVARVRKGANRTMDDFLTS